MTSRVPAVAVTALLGISAAGVALFAQEPAAPAGQVHAHEAVGHGGHATVAHDDVHYLTVNVAVSNAGLESATVFIPAGKPVQLMLRNRGTSEHHYRVVGLTPDELWWMAPGASGETTPAIPTTATADEHDHHSRHFVTTKAASPSGITPTGREVHAYVSSAT